MPDDVKNDFLIPLLRTLATGLMAAWLAVATMGIWRLVTGFRLFMFVAAAVSLATWVAYLVGNSRPVYSSQEVVFEKEAPYIEPPTTRIELVKRDRGENYPRGRWADWPVSPSQARAVARKYIATRKFTHAMGGPGNPLTRNEYEKLRDYFIDQGLAEYARPGVENSPVILTHDLIDMMEALARPGNAHAHTRTHTERKVLND